jgi:D-alanyl-D-alanine carboxypeptidase (penicillin-binding protein 5/6)
LKALRTLAVTAAAALVVGATRAPPPAVPRAPEPAPSAPAYPSAAPVPPEIPVALLVDLSTGQHLLAREIHRRFMPASVTKVMTAYTAFTIMGEGRVSPGRRFQISQELEDEWSGEGSSMFLKAGQQPTFGELLLGATTVSGNDASVALALASVGSVQNWIAEMNRNAANLGMRDTHFGSANGFPDEGRTFTTAYDLALLGEAVVTRYPGLYRRYFGHRTLTWSGLTQVNHDPITGRVPGADGMKTGFTSEAGYTFIGSGERDGRRLVMVIAGSPTGTIRDDTARALMEWGFSNFTTDLLTERGVAVGDAMVQDGSARTVALRTARPVRISRPIGSAAVKPQLAIRYQGPLMAPVQEGDQVAVLTVTVDGLPPYEVPLEAAATVEKAGFLQRMVNGIVGFVS